MNLLQRLARALASRRCPACGQPMECVSEESIDPRRAAFVLTFVCVMCGERETQVRTYGLE